MDRGLLDFDIV